MLFVYRSIEPNQSYTSIVYKLHSPYPDASFYSLSHDLEDSIPTSQIASSRSHVCDGIKIIPRDNLQLSATPLFDRGNSAVSSSSPHRGSTSNQEVGGLLQLFNSIQFVSTKFNHFVSIKLNLIHTCFHY